MVETETRGAECWSARPVPPMLLNREVAAFDGIKMKRPAWVLSFRCLTLPCQVLVDGARAAVVIMNVKYIGHLGMSKHFR